MALKLSLSVNLKDVFFKATPVVRYLVAVALPVLLFGLFVLPVFYGQVRKIGQLEAALSEKQQANLMNRHVEQELPRLKRRVEELRSQIRAGLSELPNEQEIPQLIKDLEALAEKLRMKVFFLKLQAEIPRDFYAEVPVDVKIRGAYHNTAIFFDEISRFARIISIAGVKIGDVTADKEGGSLVTTSCRATTYRYLPSDVAAPGAGTPDAGTANDEGNPAGTQGAPEGL
ncbi:MAG: type 4a pilus biogenesis protein PilO [Nitrospirae bacterium]|nr:type 4a pilus biogenesis protein PilO [Nitrospirota bacterium]